MKTYVSRIIVGFIAGVLLAIALWWMKDINFWMSVSVVLFVTLANIILEELEKDSAIKRLFRKAFKMAMVIGIFLGLRIMAQYVFQMPISSEGLSLVGRQPLHDLATDGLLELFFIAPGLAAAYAITYGKVSKNLVYWLSVLCFFFVLWEVKQPQHFTSVGRKNQATVNAWSRSNWQKEKVRNLFANDRTALLKCPAKVYRVEISQDGSIAKIKLVGKTLPTGLSVVLVDEEMRTLHGGLAFVHIRLLEMDQKLIDEGTTLGAKSWLVADNLWILAEAVEFKIAKPEKPVARVVNRSSEWFTMMVTSEPQLVGHTYSGDRFEYKSPKAFYVFNSDGGTTGYFPRSEGNAPMFSITRDAVAEGTDKYVSAGKDTEPFPIEYRIISAQR